MAGGQAQVTTPADNVARLQDEDADTPEAADQAPIGPGEPLRGCTRNTESQARILDTRGRPAYTYLFSTRDRFSLSHKELRVFFSPWPGRKWQRKQQ